MRLTSSNKQPSRKKKENAYKTTFVYQMSLVVVGGGRGDIMHVQIERD